MPPKLEEKKPTIISTGVTGVTGATGVTGVTSPMRRSSVDLADFFHKPLTNSSQQPKKKKFGVDDFATIK